MRHLLVLVASGVTAGFLGLTSGTAYADCHADGVNSGAVTTYAGAAPSDQFGAWNRADKKVRLTVLAASGMSTSRCLDAWVDWATESGHYDARLTRNCRPNSYRESDSGGDGWEPEPSDWGGRDVTGLQKGAGCVHDQNTISFITCQQYPQNLSGCSVVDDFAVSDMKWFVQYWLRKQNGDIMFNSGGKVWEPNE